MRGDSGVAGEGRVVGVPKFNSWGKCQCPNCRQNGKNVFDKRSERQIKSLKMSCENEEKGRNWQGELFNLE